MAFRYLVYRTDFGNTIIRETAASSATGGTEQELFTDFVIPAIQPLYLWRVTGGTDVVPNTDQNIADYLEATNPPTGDDAITYNIFTGYTAQTQTDLDGKVDFTIFNAFTAQTQTDLDGKIDKVTGATGNVGVFTVDGNLEDSGFAISGLTGGSDTDIYVSGMTYVGSTLTLQRTEGLPDLTVTIVSTGNTDGVVSGGTLSGTILSLQRTEGLPDVDIELSGLTSTLESDIIFLSGASDQNAANIVFLSGATDQNASDITFLSGVTDQNTTDIAFLSGATDGKVDQTDFNTYTGDTQPVIDAALTGASNGLTATGRDVTLGGELTQATEIVNSANTLTFRGAPVQYFADYSGSYDDRSIVDKAYVDSVAAGLDPKNSVQVATAPADGNIDLTGGTFAGTLDGITVQDGWRVLVKDQTDASENGIYDYTSVGSTFTRSEDFDGTPNSEVTNGAFTTVVSGVTQNATSWVVTTPDPITIGTTDIDWTILSKAQDLTAGAGIIISGSTIIFDGATVAGEFLAWDGTSLDVTGLTSIADFNSYTGATDTRITNIENDVTFLSGATDANSADITFISGVTDANSADIAFLSGATDGKLDTTDFNTYTGDTDTRISGIEDDITFLSGETSGNTQAISDLDARVTGYTATTATNSINLIHTGGTDVNTIIATEIIWHSAITTGGAYNWSGGSSIFILEDGDYEVSFNLPFTQDGNNSARGIGANLVLNNADTIDNTSAADQTSRAQTTGSVVLSPVTLSFVNGDSIDLVAFRTAQNGTTPTKENGSILIKKVGTLQ